MEYQEEPIHCVKCQKETGVSIPAECPHYKKLVRVVIDLGYYAYADDPEMIAHAKEAIYEDVMNAVKCNEIDSWINVVETNRADVSLVPEFLRDPLGENDASRNQ